MTDDDKSLGDDATLGGESPEQEVDAQSLGDQSTHGDHSQMDSVGDSSSLGDQLTFGGEGTGEALDDGMEIVDLESRYTIERVLGKGGMGEVLLATDTRLERKVAIKRILGKAAGSKTAVNRFLAEAKAVAALNHPNIVQIYDYGRDKDGPLLIMEYVPGETLLDRCQQGAVALDESIDLIAQLCDGLGAAHDANIIHRDIKPANILLTKNNIPKLTDFGLAKAEAADTGMTMAGAVLGTLDFMPPEQRKDAALVDARSDLWSLAATLYQMVTGETPRVIDLDAVPRELRTCLAKSLKTRKDDRYQTGSELGTALRECLTASVSLPVSELGFGECPVCHTRNEAGRKFCNGCAGPLRAPCFGCESEIPVWDKVCGECGFKQQERIQELRDERAKQRAEVEQLLQASEFDKAKEQAAIYRKRHDPRVDGNNTGADEFVARIDEKRESETKRIADIMAEAKSHQEEFEHDSVLRVLKQVPIALMGESVPGHPQTPQEMVEELTITVSETQRLDDLLQKRLAINEYDGLLEIVDQLQVLQPNRASLNRIHDQLAGREEELKTGSEKLALSATNFFGKRDYDECLRQIGKIPAKFFTKDIDALRQTATKKRDQIRHLRNQIERQVQSEDFQGLLPLVEDHLELQTGAEGMLELREQLVERDRKLRATRDDALAKALEFMASHDYEGCLQQINRIDHSLLVADIKALKETATANRERLGSEKLALSATNFFGKRDYDECLRQIGKIPAKFFTKDIDALRQTATKKRDQIRHLRNQIERQVQSEDFQGLLPLVEDHLELQTGAEGMLELREQLVERDRKLRATRDDALAKALEFMASHDYEGCLQQINRIDHSLLVADIKALKETATANRERLKSLRDTIDRMVQKEIFQGMMPWVVEYLELKPDSEDMLKLYERLHRSLKSDTYTALGDALGSSIHADWQVAFNFCSDYQALLTGQKTRDEYFESKLRILLERPVELARKHRVGCDFHKAYNTLILIPQNYRYLLTAEDGELFSECRSLHKRRQNVFKQLRKAHFRDSKNCRDQTRDVVGVYNEVLESKRLFDQKINEGFDQLNIKLRKADRQFNRKMFCDSAASLGCFSFAVSSLFIWLVPFTGVVGLNVLISVFLCSLMVFGFSFCARWFV